MARLRSRSGTVALLVREMASRDALEYELERCRFGIVDLAAAPDAILVDLMQNDESGFVESLCAQHEDAAIIGVDAGFDTPARGVLRAFRAGLSDAILIADGHAQIASTIKLAIERKRIERADRERSIEFARELGARARRISEAYGRIEIAYEETLHALVSALDTREEATAGHSFRVTFNSLYLAIALGLSRPALQSMYRGALLHDIGKIGIPDAILLKPGRLTADEFSVMKTHTMLGLRFLSGISYLADAIDIPYCHHERWDGTGYPRGMRGEEIPISARIFAVADVYDALRSKRCYKDAMSHLESSRIISESAGSHFDPDVVEVFLRQPPEVWDEIRALCVGPIGFATMIDECDRIARRWPAMSDEVTPT